MGFLPIPTLNYFEYIMIKPCRRNKFFCHYQLNHWEGSRTLSSIPNPQMQADASSTTFNEELHYLGTKDDLVLFQDVTCRLGMALA